MDLWKQVSGVIDPYGNPSVSEFTRLSAKQTNYRGISAFYSL